MVPEVQGFSTTGGLFWGSGVGGGFFLLKKIGVGGAF